MLLREQNCSKHCELRRMPRFQSHSTHGELIVCKPRNITMENSIRVKTHDGERSSHQQQPCSSTGLIECGSDNDERPRTLFFPEQLHQMLQTSEELGLANIVSWQPHGYAFMVHNRKLFVSQILPRFFNQSLFASFNKQLNNYGFKRIQCRGQNKGAIYNEFFLRGKQGLLKYIIRREQGHKHSVRSALSSFLFHHFMKLRIESIAEPCALPSINSKGEDNKHDSVAHDDKNIAMKEKIITGTEIMAFFNAEPPDGFFADECALLTDSHYQSLAESLPGGDEILQNFEF